jgi:hypothetical protein
MTFLLDDPVGLFEQAVLGGLGIRPVTRGLARNLYFDLPLTPAQQVDFGVATDDHYRALRQVLVGDDERREMEQQGPRPPQVAEALRELRERVKELDRALASGPELTALVKKYAPTYKGVVFNCSNDLLNKGLNQKVGR